MDPPLCDPAAWDAALAQYDAWELLDEQAVADALGVSADEVRAEFAARGYTETTRWTREVAPLLYGPGDVATIVLQSPLPRDLSPVITATVPGVDLLYRLADEHAHAAALLELRAAKDPTITPEAYAAQRAAIDGKERAVLLALVTTAGIGRYPMQAENELLDTLRAYAAGITPPEKRGPTGRSGPPSRAPGTTTASPKAAAARDATPIPAPTVISRSR